MRRLCFIFGVIAVLAAMTISVSAQSTATLTGTVKDATGAVVVGANVTIENQATGEQRKVTTNKDGFFSVTPLPVATYKVSVSAKGFARYEAKDVGLSASDIKALTIELPLASVTETVEVSGTMSTIALTDSGEKSSVLTTKELNTTPLASRNAAEIVKIMGGASMTANGGKNTPNTTSTIGINGYTVGGNAAGLGGTQINGQNLDITLDGGHTFDPGAAGSATPVNPNMDMISEVKVMASNFSAEYEKGPVVINAETKGGGKDYHGQVHLAAQNNALNATDSNYRQNGIPKIDSHAYYPGGQLGGPIPFGSYNKNHDKLFFFDGFEAYKQLVDGGLDMADVPTDAMLNGDFSLASNPNFDKWKTWPLNQTPSYSGSGHTWSGSLAPACVITAGVMDPSCIDQNSLRYLRAMLPRPNADGSNGYNFIQGINASQNSWQNVARVDWSISDNTKAYVRYSRQREKSVQPLGVWGNSGAIGAVPSPTPVDGNYLSDSLATTFTHVFSPTMTSETTFYYTIEKMPNTPEDWSKLTRKDVGLTWKGVYGNEQVPAITAWGPGLPTMGSSNNLGTDFSTSEGWRTKPGMMADKGMPSLRENFTKVLRTHTLKVGAFWEHIYNKQDNWGQYMGAEQVAQGWGESTGNSYADILMGVISGQYAEQQLTPPTQISQNLYEFYVNDHWKVNRRLSVDLGMRFDHYGKPFSPVWDLGLAVWNPAAYNNDPSALDAHTGVSWHANDKTIPLSGADSRLFFYSPRFGLAWDIFGNAKTILRGGWGLYRAYDSLQSNSYTGPAQVAMGAATFSCNTWSCPTMASIDNNATTHKLPAGLPAGLVGVNVMDPKNDQQPLVTTYSLSVDQQLPGKFMLELSYVGNHGDNLQSQVDINAVPVGTIPYADYLACTRAGNCNNDNYRLKRNYKAITESITMGKTQFDSFQVAVHRSIGWLNVRANYMWSKTFANGDLNNNGGFADMGEHEYWGIATNHRPHTFNLSYVLNLPKVRSGNSFLRGLGSGWAISGITSVNSGANQTSQNYALNYSRDNLTGDSPTDPNKHDYVFAIYDNVAQTGSSQVIMHPQILCNPNMSPVKVTLPDGTTGMQYLNTTCFGPAAAGTAGTTGMPYIAGPMYWNSDLAFMKSISITERHKLEFKVQMFNFMNHALWSFASSDPNLKFNFAADGSLKNPLTTGVATQKYGHRAMELSVRYTF